jgi:hypothetical protein
MSCRPSLSIRAPAASGCGAARSSWSRNRPKKRLHTENLAWRAAWQAEHGRGLTGRKPTPPDPAALDGGKVNTTDPDTRLMKRAGGKAVQGYNAQVVANREQVIVAANLTQSHNDADQLAPMIALTGEAPQAAGSEESVGLVLADGGYWNSPAISEVREQGIDVPIPTQDGRRTKPRKLAPKQGREAQRIEALLSRPEGQALYRKRQQFVEPVFAQTKVIRRSDHFLRRGLAACQAEWRLIAATHNLPKLWRANSRTPKRRPNNHSPPDDLARTARPRAESARTHHFRYPRSKNPAQRLCATASSGAFLFLAGQHIS